jgi:hypothetical protein
VRRQAYQCKSPTTAAGGLLRGDESFACGLELRWSNDVSVEISILTYFYGYADPWMSAKLGNIAFVSIEL